MRTTDSSPPGASLELQRGVTIAREALRWSFGRSSGPGGQAVNKVNTRAELRVSVADIRNIDAASLARLRRMAGRRLTTAGELVFTAQATRSQWDNRQACLERLRELMVAALTPPRVRKKTRVPAGATRKRLDHKRLTGAKKSTRQRRNWDD